MTTTTDTTTIVRTAYDAFGRGDIPAVLDCFHPDLVWIEAAGGRYGGTYQGPQAVVDGVFAPIGSEWDGFLVEPERLVAEGDIVVSIGTYRGKFRATGKSMTARFVHVWEVREGRLARFEQIADTASLNAVEQ